MERIFLYPVGLDLPSVLSGTGRFKNRKKKLKGLYHPDQKGFAGALNLPAYYYIISKIVRASVFEADYKHLERPYVKISSSLMASITGNPDFLTDLLHAGVIERAGSYKVGANCYKYRLTEKYSNLKFKVYKGKHNLKFDEVEKLEDISDGCRYVLKSMELFEFDVKLARKMLRTLEDGAKQGQEMLIDVMEAERELCRYDYKVGGNSGRLFSSITSQKRAFRKLWKLAGEPVAIVDVSACQPALLYSLYEQYGQENTQEAEFYKSKIENGGFYEIFVEDSEVDLDSVLTREEVKPNLYVTWFGNEEWSSSKDASVVRNCFIRYFPIMYSILSKIKKDNHKLAARLLQSMESKTIFGSVVPRIRDLGIPCLTIHDAVVVPQSKANEAKEVLEKEFSELLKLKVRASISIPSYQ
jgi:hypothetical protein